MYGGNAQPAANKCGRPDGPGGFSPNQQISQGIEYMTMCNTMLRPAVFLDRDGTIIEDRGYLSCLSQVVFFDDTVPALQKLQAHFDLFIVTNQSGVARKLITPEDVVRVNRHVLSHLARSGIRIVETYVCPHARHDDCRCMKPKPYFLRKAETDHQVDLARSFVLGDHPHDVTFGENAGAKGIYLLTGHGEKHLSEVAEGTTIVHDIRDAVELILGKLEKLGSE